MRRQGKVLRGGDSAPDSDASVALRHEQPSMSEHPQPCCCLLYAYRKRDQGHQPRYPSFLAASVLAPLDAGGASPAAAAKAFVSYKASRPFVMRHGLQGSSAAGLASAILQVLTGLPPSATLDVLSSSGQWGRLIAAQPPDTLSALDPSGEYHLRWPECKMLERVPIHDLAGMLSSWSSTKLLAQLDLCTLQLSQAPWEGDAASGSSSGAALSVAAAATVHAAPSQQEPGKSAWCAELKDGVVKPIAAWLHTYLLEPAAELTQAAHICRKQQQDSCGSKAVWASDDVALDGAGGAGPRPKLPSGTASVSLEWASVGAMMPLKYETTGRLITQVQGQRHVLLVPPDFALGGALAPFPCAHPYDKYSAPGMACTASATADAALAKHVASLWPGFKQVRGMTCTMQPGDVLYVPPYWSMHTETLPAKPMPTAAEAAAAASCMALVLNLTPAPRGCSLQVPDASATTLQATRQIELWAGAQLGPRRVRALLLRLSSLLHHHDSTLREAAAAACAAAAAGQRPPAVLPFPEHWSRQLGDLVPEAPAAGSGATGEFQLALLGQDILDALACCCTSSGAPDACTAAPLLDARAAASLLAAMCDGRLLPTPWLEQFGQRDACIPSQLAGYQYLAPALTREEATFPELFRAAIKEKEQEAAEQAQKQHYQRLATGGKTKLLL